MRRVLMLSYYFPPILAAGTQRSAAFAKLLPAFGWTPHVLTVQRPRVAWEAMGEHVPDEVLVVRTPEWNLQRLVMWTTGLVRRACKLAGREARASLYYDLCLPDPQLAWFSTLPGAWLARRCDCIYVSCSPFSSALSGCLIKAFTGRPLVVDFRDAWSLNPHANLSAASRRIVGRLEEAVLRHADALVVNTPGAERAYCRRYPRHAHKIVAIPNGFDRLMPSNPCDASDTFRIMHVGDFYGSRRPEPLLDALANLHLDNVEFVQLGRGLDAGRYEGRVRVRCLDKVPHEEALRLMTGASLLYLNQGVEPGVRDYIAIASKTYEYLASGLPILADCPPGDNAELVRRYANRAYVVTSGRCEDLKAAVLQAYMERTLPSVVTEQFAAEFDRRNLTQRLADVLERASDGRRIRPGMRESDHAASALAGSQAQRVGSGPGQLEPADALPAD